MSGIFISYRADDAKAWALMLRDELARAFGDERVFLDLDGLQAGNRRRQVEAALARSKVALVVIGPRWLISGGQGDDRAADAADGAHRQELALALSTPGLTVIPVRVDGAAMPRAEQLGADLRALAGQHSRTIADPAAQRALDLKLLLGDVERATGLVARSPAAAQPPASVPAAAPAPAAASLSGRSRLLAVAAALGVVFVVAARLTWTTPPDAIESSFLVLIAWLLTLAGSWVKGRFSRKG